MFFDGSDHWLADGFHRYHAANKAGWKGFAAHVNRGTVRDAQWYSFGANKDHGLRRQRGDIKRAVQAILMDDEWRAKSQRDIAEHIGCAQQFVSQIQTQLTSTSKLPDRSITTSRDGRTRDTSNIGRSKSEKQTEIIDTQTGEVLDDAAVLTIR